MLLTVLNDALCPHLRARLWMKRQRELSLLNLMRHLHTFAASWMQAIGPSEFVWRRVLTRVCATAARLTAHASRTRQTPAQILHDRLQNNTHPSYWRKLSRLRFMRMASKGSTSAANSSTVKLVKSHTSVVWVGISRYRTMICASFRGRHSITQIVMNSNGHLCGQDEEELVGQHG